MSSISIIGSGNLATALPTGRSPAATQSRASDCARGTPAT